MNKDFLINVFGRWENKIKAIDPVLKDEIYTRARANNGWFTKESIDLAFNGLRYYLDPEKLESWLVSFDYRHSKKHSKKIGIVMAGNVPMVGLHDLLCVIVSGHSAIVKLSSKDEVLIPYLVELLYDLEPEFKNRIRIVDRLEKPDAVIATGSNNSARYFNYYFRDIPHIIRKNRTSVGIINGQESPEALLGLGKDILTYFGLGCRNVSKLFIQDGLEFNSFFEAIQPLESVADIQKYVHNYDYNKSIYLVNKEQFLDNGFLMVKRSGDLVSPVSVVYYETYKDINELNQLIDLNRSKIQCLTSDDSWFANSIDFGTTQQPDLWDYADNVNTVEFLEKI